MLVSIDGISNEFNRDASTFLSKPVMIASHTRIKTIPRVRLNHHRSSARERNRTTILRPPIAIRVSIDESQIA